MLGTQKRKLIGNIMLEFLPQPSDSEYDTFELDTKQF